MDGAASFPAQVISVVLRRAPVFQPGPGEPTTFSGHVRSWWRHHRAVREANQDSPPASRIALAPGVVVFRPVSYIELRDVGEAYRDGNLVFMDVAQMGPSDAKRAVDFAAGLIFGTGGGMERTTNRLFVLRPPGLLAPEMGSEYSAVEDYLRDHPADGSAPEILDLPTGWIAQR
jgi:hypothetical protein